MERKIVCVNGINLSYLDFGGAGPATAVLLHGLTGRASHWRLTAEWLTEHYRVLALDQRGHGLSDKPPTGAYTREHYVADVIAFIEHVGGRPAVLVGHSMGAQNAMLAAVRRPDLVRGLVLIDQRVSANPGAQDVIQNWFDSWPMPLRTEQEVRAFRGGNTPVGDAFLECLVPTAQGYQPEFAFDQMIESIADQVTVDYWDAVGQVACPTLVVAGEQTWMPIDELREVARRLPQGQYAEVAGAGHGVCLDQPEGWRRAAEPLLAGLRGS